MARGGVNENEPTKITVIDALAPYVPDHDGPEIVFAGLADLHFSRAFDPQTGYPELDIKPL